MNYESHFNSKLDKCLFLEIVTVVEKGNHAKQLRLFDLNENKEYGSYFTRTKRLATCPVRFAMLNAPRRTNGGNLQSQLSGGLRS